MSEHTLKFIITMRLESRESLIYSFVALASVFSFGSFVYRRFTRTNWLRFFLCPLLVSSICFTSPPFLQPSREPAPILFRILLSARWLDASIYAFCSTVVPDFPSFSVVLTVSLFLYISPLSFPSSLLRFWSLSSLSLSSQLNLTLLTPMPVTRLVPYIL